MATHRVPSPVGPSASRKSPFAALSDPFAAETREIGTWLEMQRSSMSPRRRASRQTIVSRLSDAIRGELEDIMPEPAAEMSPAEKLVMSPLPPFVNVETTLQAISGDIAALQCAAAQRTLR